VPDRANIASIEALEAFRTHLIVYLNNARPALDEVRGEIIRARLWLEADRQSHWEAQIRRCERRLQDAEAELFKLRISAAENALQVAQQNVRKCRQALAEAEAKLKAVRKWIRNFDQDFGPFLRQVERLRDLLAGNMDEALFDLTRTVGILADYAQVRPASGSTPAIPEEGQP